MIPCTESLAEHIGSPDPSERRKKPLGGQGWKWGARGVGIGQANGGRWVEEENHKGMNPGESTTCQVIFQEVSLHRQRLSARRPDAHVYCLASCW